MLRFLMLLLVFVIGGAIGFWFGGAGGGAVGLIVGSCKVVNAAVASNQMTQDGANASVKAAFSELAKEIGVTDERLKQALPQALERMKKEHGDTETPCQAALKTI
jgi:hypothetical protein